MACLKRLAVWGLLAKRLVLVSGCSQCRHYSDQQQAPEDEFHVNYLDGNSKGIAVFSMRRFRYKNAMGRNFMKRIVEGVNQVKYDGSVLCVILRSEVPGVFCAGADLKERAAMTNKEVFAFGQTLRFATSELAALPMPTIAAIEGAALGGGLEMALACDIRVAASTAKIGLIETSLAIFPGAGGSQRLPRTIGVPKAKELIFTSRRLNGYQAKKMGVVSHVVEQNAEETAAYDHAVQLAHDILLQDPLSLRMAKMSINQGIEVDLRSGLKFEESYYSGAIPT